MILALDHYYYLIALVLVSHTCLIGISFFSPSDFGAAEPGQVKRRFKSTLKAVHLVELLRKYRRGPMGKLLRNFLPAAVSTCLEDPISQLKP